MSDPVEIVREGIEPHHYKAHAALDDLAAETATLRATLVRAVYVANHLHAMIDQETWRATGGDDMQGHYEGDYHAEQVAAEIKEWAALAAGKP